MSDKTEKYEFVEHPLHYNQGSVECWDFNEWFPGNTAAALKHLWRLDSKPGSDRDTDLNKAIEYLKKEVSKLRKYPKSFNPVPFYPDDDVPLDDVLNQFDEELRIIIRTIYNSVFECLNASASVQKLNQAIEYIKFYRDNP